MSDIKAIVREKLRYIRDVITKRHNQKIWIESSLINFDRRNLLGKGSYGSVYRGTYCGSLPAAVKTVDALSFVDWENDQILHYVVDEVSALRQFNFERIVQLYGVCIVESELWLVMQFMSNGNLSAVQRKLKLTAAQRKRIAQQTTEALVFIHSKSAVHRDMKPQNILLDENLSVRLGDFGMVRKLRQGKVDATARMGTYAYMSPEQFSGESITDKSDIYSLGIIFLELCIDRSAWTDIPEMKRDYENITPPIPDFISLQLRGLLEEMLAKHPDQRPSSTEVLHRLASVDFPSLTSSNSNEQMEIPSEPVQKMHRAWALMLGQGLDRDTDLAIRIIRECCDTKHPRALSLMAMWYGRGFRSIKRDPKLSSSYLQEAVQAGDVYARYRALARGLDCEAHPHAAFELLEQSDLTDPVIQNAIGWCCEHGSGCERNLSFAVGWYKLAASQGYSTAQENLASCYYLGKGTPQDLESALFWFSKAAEQGDSPAMCNLGYCYEHGEGVEVNFRTAVQWYRESAELGNVTAQFNLAGMYYLGGVTQDFAQAAFWYQRAADQDHADALFYLGICYRDGSGVVQDKDRAVSYLKRAALLGHPQAEMKHLQITQQQQQQQDTLRR